MAVEFEKLKFTRDWNNSSDFPTYEENEQKVRADLQALHDETKEFINETLIPSIENLAVPGTGDMLAGIYDPHNKRKDVYQYADDRVAEITLDSIGAAGSEDFAAHADNKENPHKVTADQIGAIGLNTYAWEIIEPGANKVVEKDKSQLSYDTTSYFFIADSYKLSEDGTKYILTNPESVGKCNVTTVEATNGHYWVAASGVSYAESEHATINYTPVDSPAATSAGNSAMNKQYRALTVEWFGEYTTGLVYSTDINAYPQDGEQDGKYYRFYGSPVEQSVLSGLRIRTGSYTGTGTSGVANPTYVQLGIVPKVVFLMNKESSTERITIFFPDKVFSTSSGSVSYTFVHSFNGSTLYMCNTQPNGQFNNQNVEYLWIAIG